MFLAPFIFLGKRSPLVNPQGYPHVGSGIRCERQEKEVGVEAKGPETLVSPVHLGLVLAMPIPGGHSEDMKCTPTDLDRAKPMAEFCPRKGNQLRKRRPDSLSRKGGHGNESKEV